jgi:peroxiredoxin
MKALSTVFLIAALWLMTGAVNATTTLPIGQPAPDFTLKDLNGAKHALKDQHGKITVIAFLSVQCPISNAYNERIRELAADYVQQSVSFLAINSSANETVAEIKAHVEKQGFQFPILKDKGNKVADLYHAERTPEIFVVDAQGILRYHGRIDNSHLPIHVKRRDLREALNELLAGKPVSVPEAKALGCVIKREQSAQRDATSDHERVSFARPAFSMVSPFTFPFTQKAQGRTSPTAKKPMPKTKSASAKNASAPTNIALLKPADFPKLRDSYKGKVIVLNFWATWCAPCVAEMPEFIKLDADYRSKGVQVLAISADDTTDLKTLVTRFVKEKGMTFPVYVQDTDDPQQMIDLINKDWPGVLPATFIYDKQGTLILSRFGIIDRELLVNTVEQALK